MSFGNQKSWLDPTHSVSVCEKTLCWASITNISTPVNQRLTASTKAEDIVYCEPEQIEELVLALPEPLQSVVRLRLDSKSLTDIAAIRGVSVGTISRQFRKAVELLKISAGNN